METPYFYRQETREAVAYHKSAPSGIDQIEDFVPLVKFLVTVIEPPLLVQSEG